MSRDTSPITNWRQFVQKCKNAYIPSASVPLLLSEEVSGHAVVVVEDGDDLPLDGLVVHVGQRHPVTLAAVHRLAGPGPCHLGLGVTEPNPRRRDININTRGNSP